MGNIIEVFRPVCHVQSDKRRMRMLGKHAITRSQERFLAGELWTIKTPVGVFDQFFIPLIRVVDWVKESFRIGGVNGNWNAEPSAFLPDGIEARIIHCHQLPRLVAYS